MNEENKPKRGRPRLSDEEKKERALKRQNGELQSFKRPDSTVQASPGDNAQYIRHALANLSMPPIDISDPAQVEDRVMWYFNHCIEDDMKPTVMGLANAMGVNRDTIQAWHKGEYRAGTHQHIIQRAYALMEEQWQHYMLNGKVNPVAGIFLAKNLFGYSDKQEYVVTPNTQQLSQGDLQTIEAKYDELPDGDEE
jgi:hypothetical protein